jgi:molecular chaperone GrpE (heat shock protein)
VVPPRKERYQNLLPPGDLAIEIEKLRDDLRNERDRNLRTLADFKDYRRRAERDGSKLAGEGKRAFILPLLNIIDDLEKVLPWVRNEKQPFAGGVRIIHQKLLALLEAQGVELRRGYLRNTELLRPAQLRVAG